MVGPNERMFKETTRRNQTYVATVIIEVLKSCNAMGYCPDEALVPQVRHLADLVLSGLPQDFVPRVSNIQLAEAIHKEMRSKFGPYMNIEIDLKNPLKEAAMADCIQSRIMLFSRECQRSNIITFCLGAITGALIVGGVAFHLNWLTI